MIKSDGAMTLEIPDAVDQGVVDAMAKACSCADAGALMQRSRGLRMCRTSSTLAAIIQECVCATVKPVFSMHSKFARADAAGHADAQPMAGNFQVGHRVLNLWRNH